MSLFGCTVSFTNLSEAVKEWGQLCLEIIDVQYSSKNRGKGRRRRAVTNSVKQFIALACLLKAQETDDKVVEEWTDLITNVETQFESMLAAKETLQQGLDNVW
tara:strand:- start:303 stop:611 length:309 start_codon:yes stop_codon:yes gene_type:complete